MKLNYAAILENFDGKPFVASPEVRGGEGNIKTPATHLTLKDAILIVFSSNLAGDNDLPALDKFKLGKIGYAVSKEAELPLEDVTKIKDRLGRGLSTPALVFAAWDAIDPEPAE